MTYSYKIEQAIRAASILHKDMVSEGKAKFPYVSHLFSVACIIADYTDDEDTIIAGLLHDTVACTGYTLKELAEDFGQKVSILVNEIGIPSSADTRADWKEAHARAMTQVKHASDDALIVIAADHIHRMRSVVEEGSVRFPDRIQNGSDHAVDGQMATCQGIGNVLNSRLKNDIVHEFNHVFDEYKNCIYGAKSTHTETKK